MKRANDVTLVLETKGMVTTRRTSSTRLQKRWIVAVNDWVEPGPWAFHVNKNLQMLAVELRYLIGRA
jgi:hypothetical protein